MRKFRVLTYIGRHPYVNNKFGRGAVMFCTDNKVWCTALNTMT